MNELVMVGVMALIFLVLCFFLEAIMISLFRVCRLGRAFLYALLVNFISLLLIYLGWPLIRFLQIDTGTWFPLFPILFLFTVLIETVLLKWLIRHHPWARLVLIVMVMNTLSFAALYLVLSLI